MTLLPSVSSLSEYEAIRRNDALFSPGATAIVARHGLGSLPLDRFSDGSLPVYAVGSEVVLKLYPPFELEERDHEAGALAALEQRLPIPTPSVHAVGDFESWGYLLMGRLRGVPLDDVWPALSHEERSDLCSQLGAALRELHAIRGPALDPLRLDWSAFVDEQRRTAVDRQRSRGLEETWWEQIPAFLEATIFSSECTGRATRPSPPEALLHTEIMRDHLLVEPAASGWRLSGLFDFEPAMVGSIEYEFVAAGLFVTDGDARLLRTLLKAYGHSGTAVGPGFTRLLMAFCLLHRYANLPWFLRRLPPPAGTRTLDELADCWFGFGA